MIKILIIDDDKDTCDYLKDYFEIRKCEVLTAQSGKQGLDLFAQNKPKIVLLDVRMEGMDGIETLKEIKKQDSNVCVIMITVASDEYTRHLAKEAGADDFIKKPLNIQYLEGTVGLKIADLTKQKGDETLG